MTDHMMMMNSTGDGGDMMMMMNSTDGDMMGMGSGMGSGMGMNMHDGNHDHMMGMDGDSDAFCTGGMGMVMYMNGFHWTLKGGQPCINLYFPGWTLDTVGKTIGAMIGILFLAMLTEYVSKVRHNISVKSANATTSMEARNLRLMQTGLHGFHALIGYVLMLATMTFSLELLFCVVIGLTIGYVIFGGDTYSHVTTNPCCQFLEEEANEVSVAVKSRREIDATVATAGGATITDTNTTELPPVNDESVLSDDV